MTKRFLPRSLRWRLQLWLAFLLVCVLAGFGVTVYQLQRVTRFNQIDGELESRISALTAAVRGLYANPPDHFDRRPRPEDDKGRGFPERLPPRDHPDFGPPHEGHGFPNRGMRPEMDGPGRHGPPPFEMPKDLSLTAETQALFGSRPNDFYYVVWNRDGSVLKRSPNAPADLPRPDGSERDTLTHLRTRELFREGLICSGIGDCVLAGRPVASDLQAMRNFAWMLLGAGGGVLALALGLGYWFGTRAIRPIENISAAASRISYGNLSERIEGGDTGDELGSLTQVLNSTFSRLEAAFARQRQFTADAAHELRTPLAVIISETQTVLARERSAADYRETVEACLDTAQQMRRLTESLLELARFDAENRDHPREVIDVAETAQAAIERVRPLAAKHGIKIQTELAPARARTDSGRIGQVITNLLTNAIYYNKPDGKVVLATRQNPDGTTIAVTDTGVGIAAADLAHIFDRFYRVDKARSRAEGHTGLGLAICKAIVESEGGTIEVTSVLDAGTTFKVRLPEKR